MLKTTKVSWFHLAKGRTNAEIAQELSISTRTAAYHVHNLLTKLDANNRTEAAANAVKRGWLRDE